MEALKENPHFQGPELFVNRHKLGATAGGVLLAIEDARGEVKARRQPVYLSQAVALGLRRTCGGPWAPPLPQNPSLGKRSARV